MKGLSSIAVLIAALAVVTVGIMGSGLDVASFIPSTISGGTFLSITTQDFLSNDPDLGGKAWVLNVVQNGRGQYAVGTKNAEGITDGDYEAGHDVRIETFVDKHQCEYNINPGGEYLYHLVIEKFTRTVAPYDNAAEFANFERNCKNRPNWMFHTKAWSSDYYCIWTTSDKAVGYMATPFYAFQSRIKATSDGKAYEGTVSNAGATSVKVSDKLYAYWQGNLVSGYQCPTAPSERVFALYDNGRWRVADWNDYEIWKDEYNSLDSCVASGDPYNCVNNINYFERAASAGTVLADFSNTRSAGSENDGKVIVPFDRLLQFPLITMKLDADWIGWVGIVQPVGQPRILELSSVEFEQNGWISAKVTNEGGVDASFGLYAECNPPFSYIGGTKTVQLTPAQMKYVSLPISATVASDTCSQCRVTMTDLNNPSNMDSGTVRVCATPITVCNPGEARCNVNTIEQCNSQGSGWDTFEVCAGGETCRVISGQPVCVGDDRCATEGQSCDSTACCEGLQCRGGVLGVGKTCQSQLPWWHGSLDYIYAFVGAAVISLVILFLLWMFTPVKLFFTSSRAFIVAWLIMTVGLAALFAVPMFTLGASIMGGAV